MFNCSLDFHGQIKSLKLVSELREAQLNEQGNGLFECILSDSTSDVTRFLVLKITESEYYVIPQNNHFLKMRRFKRKIFKCFPKKFAEDLWSIIRIENQNTRRNVNY